MGKPQSNFQYRTIFGVPLIAGNGLWLCAGGALKHESFNPPLNFNRITNDEYNR